MKTLELTKAEEQVMQILWKIEKGFVHDIIELLPKPKPAYNTVSTIVRILEKKGFVGFKAYGKSHQYYPLVAKNDYAKSSLGKIMNNYFSGSVKNLVSHFAENDELDIQEIDDAIQLLYEIKNKQK